MSSDILKLGFLGPLAPKSNIDLARLGVVAALIGLILFGALRYDNFISQYNALSFLRYNSMFALIALGMALVIMTGGIDLSVGGTAAMASVVAALLSPYHWAAGLAGGLAAGLAVGLINGLVITKLRIQPFIATLAAMLAAYGTGLLLAGNQSVSVSYDSGFTIIGQDDFLGFPIPAWIAILFYVAGWIALERHAVGRRILAIGDGEATAKLMGLKVERTLMGVYMTSGLLRRHGRRHPRLAVRRRPADRRRRLGAFRHRIGRRRRHAAHRRRRLDRRDARRRASACHGLQHPELRERPWLDLAVGLLAVGHPRPVPARRRRPAG